MYLNCPHHPLSTIVAAVLAIPLALPPMGTATWEKKWAGYLSHFKRSETPRSTASRGSGKVAFLVGFDLQTIW